MRPNRLPAVLFASALILMTGTLGWVVWESQHAQSPSSAASTTSTVAPKAAKSSSQPVLPSKAEREPLHEADASPQIETLNVPGSVPNEALLTFHTAAALAAFRDRAAALGVEVLGYDPKLRSARVRFRDLSGLQRDLHDYGKDYSHVGPNYIVRVPGLPLATQTDTANAGGREPFRSQGLEMIGATANRSAWGQGVTVAVIDSGIASHPSLQNAQITHIDMLNDGSTMNGHGTAMASLIAGNDETVGGVAPASKLIDIRVTDADGISNTALLSSAIVKATDLGARVINISLGSGTSTPMLEEAVRYAQSHNVLIVAAAGNEQQTALAMPAGLPGVISVAAVDANGTQAWFSNSGNGLTLAAPGVGIVSGYTGNKLVISSGTSQATAITTGVVAALLSRGYYAQNIIPLLTRTAKPLQATPQAVGAGLIQITK